MTARKPRSQKVEFEASETGRGKVVVDGQDVSGMARSVTVESTVGEATRVVIGLTRVTVTNQVTGAVEVDGPTRDFLLTLGWTPPAEV